MFRQIEAQKPLSLATLGDTSVWAGSLQSCYWDDLPETHTTAFFISFVVVWNLHQTKFFTSVQGLPLAFRMRSMHFQLLESVAIKARRSVAEASHKFCSRVAQEKSSGDLIVDNPHLSHSIAGWGGSPNYGQPAWPLAQYGPTDWTQQALQFRCQIED